MVEGNMSKFEGQAVHSKSEREILFEGMCTFEA
jgi:hypothetical protein